MTSARASADFRGHVGEALLLDPVVLRSLSPKLLAEIEYRAKSAEGKVRHPFFKGLREDL